MDQERDIRKVDRDKLVDFLKLVDQDDDDNSMQDGENKHTDNLSEQAE